MVPHDYKYPTQSVPKKMRNSEIKGPIPMLKFTVLLNIEQQAIGRGLVASRTNRVP